MPPSATVLAEQTVGAMPAPQIVIQAAVSRLSARLGSGLLDVAAQAAGAVQEAPERLRQELALFWQEVEQEADRLERADASGHAPEHAERDDGAMGADLQAQIDALRAHVAAINQQLDQAP